MRINKFVAQASGLSRRAADAAIEAGRVTINGQPAELGDDIPDGSDVNVRLDDQLLQAVQPKLTIMLNKPAGYVVSRDGQGSQTIYDLLPAEYQHLKPVGRLDKDSSGLLLLTNDGQLAQELTHPKYQKQKIYEVTLDKPLAPLHQQMINDHGIQLDDGTSKFTVIPTEVEGSLDFARDDKKWTVIMSEGRNRQIRRTFAALGYDVTKLHRTQFGSYNLDSLQSAQYHVID